MAEGMGGLISALMTLMTKSHRFKDTGILSSLFGKDVDNNFLTSALMVVEVRLDTIRFNYLNVVPLQNRA